MNKKDKFSLAYLILTGICLTTYMIIEIAWLFFGWFGLTLVGAFISFISSDIQRDKRLQELEDKFAISEVSE